MDSWKTLLLSALRRASPSLHARRLRAERHHQEANESSLHVAISPTQDRSPNAHKPRMGSGATSPVYAGHFAEGWTIYSR